MATNWKQLKAIEYKNKQRILKVCPDVPETSGIYIFLREEDGFKYAYIGQAKHLLTRLAQHLKGYQHIDLSIRKHGLKSESKPNGWDLIWFAYPINKLDEMEQYYVKMYANDGFQLRNSNAGSQSKGRHGLDNNKPPKGYYDGKKQGYRDAQKFVANLFEKHLIYGQRSAKPNKNQEKAMVKFREFLNYEGDDEEC